MRLTIDLLLTAASSLAKRQSPTLTQKMFAQQGKGANHVSRSCYNRGTVRMEQELLFEVGRPQTAMQRSTYLSVGGVVVVGGDIAIAAS